MSPRRSAEASGTDGASDTNTDAASGANADVAALGYESARDELVEVVRRLEQGGLDLETSLALWERGEALAARCEEQLAGARKRIEDVIAEREAQD